MNYLPCIFNLLREVFKPNKKIFFHKKHGSDLNCSPSVFWRNGSFYMEPALKYASDISKCVVGILNLQLVAGFPLRKTWAVMIYRNMKHLYMIAVAALCFFEANAQTMEQVFAEMPDSIVPVMTKNNRLDCIDFYKSNMKPNVENLYGGKSELLKLDDNYLLLRPTSVSTVAMRKFVPTAGETFIVVAYTYSSPAKDTDIKFYTMSWKPLPAGNFVSPPEKKEFFVVSDTCDAERLAYASSACEDAFVCVELSEKEESLRYSLSVEALAPEERDRVLPYVKDAIVYEWNGKKFSR